MVHPASADVENNLASPLGDGVGPLDDEGQDGHLVVEGLCVVTGCVGDGDQVLLLFSTSK